MDLETQHVLSLDEIDERAKAATGIITAYSLNKDNLTQEELKEYNDILEGRNIEDLNGFERIIYVSRIKFWSHIAKKEYAAGIIQEAINKQKEVEKEIMNSSHENIFIVGTNMALVYSFNTALVQVGLKRFTEYHKDANRNNKQIDSALGIIMKRNVAYDDIACGLIKYGIMPMIDANMKAFADGYKGYVGMLDDIQELAEKKSNEIFRAILHVCGEIDCEAPMMIKYAIVISAVCMFTIEQITLRINSLNEHEKKIMKEEGCSYLGFSELKEISEKCRLIACIASGYSIKRDMMEKMQRDVKTRLYNIYNGIGKRFIDIIAIGHKRYMMYYFACMALMVRRGEKIPQWVKDECIHNYGSKGGYTQVMKDVRKLERLSWDSNIVYDVARILDMFIENGEKFPAFDRIISKIILTNGTKNTTK